MDQTLDPRKVIPGFHGELFNADGQKLVQVNTWQLQVNVTNTDYQPAGSPQSVKIFQGYSVSLVFTETVVEDATLLKNVMDNLKAGIQPQLAFQGKIKGHDGKDARYVCRGCVPDGQFDIANIQPGDVLSRAWAWGVNEAPDLQSLLGV